MANLVFATNNEHKVAEIQAVLGSSFNITTLKEAGIDIEIPEPFDTLEENAREKAITINRLTGKDCFSEDTGLFIDHLNGEPGVKSARYAGNQSGSQENIHKVLEKLGGRESNAHFKTVICLIKGGTEFYFQGICKGRIINHPTGTFGFGYDPVFIPDGSPVTFGEMNMEEKNKFSHRKKAVSALVEFLNRKNED